MKKQQQNIIASNDKKKKSHAFQWIFMEKKSFIVSTCNTKHTENKSYTALEKKNTATGYLRCIYSWWRDEL